MRILSGPPGLCAARPALLRLGEAPRKRKKRVARPATRYKKRLEAYAAAGAAFFRREDLRRVVLRAVLRAAFLRPPVFLRAAFLRPPAFLRPAFLRPPVFLRAAFFRPPAFLRLDFLRVDLRAVDLRAVFFRRVVDLRAALRGAAFLAVLLRAAFLRLTAIVGGVTFLWLQVTRVVAYVIQ